MSQKTFQTVCVCLSVLMIFLTVLINVQLFFVIQDKDADAIPVSNNDVTNNQTQTPQKEYKSSPMPMDISKIDVRSTIDKFENPSLWTGADANTSTNGEMCVVSNGDDVEAYRKYDGFIQLQNYLYIDIEVINLPDIEWIALFLLEDLSYANYYECNLMPLISEGSNTLIINRRDFITGTGTPEWDSISTIKLGFKAKAGKNVEICIHEISTYDATPMCSLWFDDGWKSVYTNAFPVMKSNEFAGTISVISSHVGYEAFCSQKELKTMYDAGWDMTNHTHSHANLTEITTEQVDTEVSTCFTYLMDNGFERAASHFVPPFCSTNEEVDAVISEYASTSRPNWNSFNYLPVRDAFALCFREVTPDITPQTVQEWIDEAITYDLWLVLLFHLIETPADTPTKYPKEDFDTIVTYLAEKKTEIDVMTVSEVFAADVVQTNERDVDEVADEDTEGDWRLVWQDDFNGSTLDAQAWNVVEAPPFKNNELQTYALKNVSVEDGCLKIVSTEKDGNYLSGAVTTENKQLFQQGKIEIRARLPEGKGIFPALWMLPQSGADYPEVDIIEFLGDKPKEIWHVMHYEQDGKKLRVYEKVLGSSYNDDYHVFSIEWTDDGVVWRIDGEQTLSTEKYIPNDKMYLYINTAVGGNWPGSPDTQTAFPQTMLIDYVKYYQKTE